MPFTTKEDLRLSYPDTMLTVDPEQVIRMHTSSGTTGKPTAIFHTREDIDNWAELMARCLAMAGRDAQRCVSEHVRLWPVHRRAWVCTTARSGSGCGSFRRARAIPPGRSCSFRDFHVTVIHATPSYAMHVAERMVQEGDDPKSLGIKIAALGAEPYTEELRLKLQDLYGFKAFNSYGLSEMNGPGRGV